MDRMIRRETLLEQGSNSQYLDLINVANIQHAGSGSRVHLESVYTIDSVSPLVISNNGIVTVTYTAANPEASDWIGAYSPPDVDITVQAPVLYGCCTGSCSGAPLNNYLTSKTASLRFNMTNLRAGIKFYYFIGGTSNGTAVASYSSVVTFQNINQPIKNRVVPTGDVNTFNLLWSTANATAPYLKWGTSPGNYQYYATGTIQRILQSQLCAPPANTTGFRDLGNINTATFTGINDLNLYNQDIYYVFGDALLNSFSPEVKFHVPPRSGTQPPTRPTTLVLMGDLGVGVSDSSVGTEVYSDPCPPAINTTMSITGLLQENAIDAVVLTGDLSYANGYLSSWDFFLNMISPMTGGSLMLTTVGNHESDSFNSDSLYDLNSSGGECTVPSGTLLPMPAPGSITQPWYSYEIGLFHFTMMSTEHNYTIGSPQYQWLESDLASVNRTRTPWLLFTGHRGMYVDSTDCCAVGTDLYVANLLQQNIEPLLYKYQVNLAFSGHFHNLQRQSAIYQNKTVLASVPVVDSQGETVHYYQNPKATVWMIIGSAGRGPTLSTINYTWSERYWNNVYGYATVSAVNATMLSWKLIQSSNNEVLDNVIITQDFAAWAPADNNSNSNSAVNIGLVVGLTVGLVFGAVLVAIAVWYYWNRVRKPSASLASQQQENNNVEFSDIHKKGGNEDLV
jgi:hypothetical protein